MTRTFTLVVEYQLPDDTDLDAAMRSLLEAIHDLSPSAPGNVTAYADVSAELVASAAHAGALLPQTERLQLQPDDVVKITLGPDHGDEQYDEVIKIVPQLFPDHRVVVLSHGAAIEAAPADETGGV